MTFQTFFKEFKKLLSSITEKAADYIIIVGEFSAISTTRWSRDTTTTEGANIEALTSYQGFEQVINKPTHFLPNSASCINLTFADKPNLVVESGLFPLLHVKCRQIVYSKLNLNVVCPPPNQR